MEKVIFDTDIGGDIDDAICLAYLLNEPSCELLGITTVCGESEKRAMIADAICKAANRKIPIYAGEDLPMQKIPMYPTPEGAPALKHWEHDCGFVKGTAVEFLWQMIQRYPDEITLIATGNMTNLALLFRTYPESVKLLKALYVMNGYFGKESLPHPYYNWNSWADPLASKLVFAAKVKTHRAVTLEVTQTLSLCAEEAESFFGGGTRLMDAVLDFGNEWLKNSGLLTLHDPLAAVAVFHPEVCSYVRGNVFVETQEEKMGATVFQQSPQGNVEISVSADKERFYDILKHTLKASIR